MDSSVFEIAKNFVFVSILYVWVIRYQNIVTEFQAFGYPNWLRDLIGITKISFALMIINSNPTVVMVGATGIVVLMLAALLTHVKIKNPAAKMVPSFSLLVLCLFILSE